MTIMIILTFLFVICANITISNANYYYIIPSQNVSCPQEPCHTLSQFAGNASQYDGNNSNITLLFQPGNHSLSVELSVAAANNFSIIAASTQDDDTAFVRCFNQSGRFLIRDSTFVWIKGLHFIGCGGNEIIQAKHFILKDATFLGVSLGRWNSSLVLHRVANGEIVKNSFILNSITAYYGGAVYVTDSSISIVDSYFASNSASYRGGVVYSVNSAFTITTSHFADNSAHSGGVIYSSASFFIVTDSDFVDNSASYGGVLYTCNSTFSINTSKFANNRASNYGGVIAVLDVYMSGSSSFFSINSSNFVNNSALDLGGVLYTQNNSSHSISSSNFANNKASSGGVIYAYGSFFNNISRSNFINNTALHYNRVMNTPRYTVQGTGGAIYAHYSSFIIGFGSFIGNRADDKGGVLYVETYSLFNIATSNFTYNCASNIGGVMYIISQSSLNINYSGIENNEAGRGGVMYTDGSSFNISASYFNKNSAYYGGGVIQTRRSWFSILASNFTENSVSRYNGGVMYLDYESSIIISTSRFTINSAGKSGGVMCTLQSSVSIADSSFIANSASCCGGAIFTDYGSFLNITNSSFTNNTASAGGVMFIQESSASWNNISSSKFTENGALYGGVIFLYKSSLNILKGNFDNNSALLNKFDDKGKVDAYTNQTTCSGKLIAKLIGNKIYECDIYSGIVASYESSFNITNSTFIGNRAVLGVMNAFNSLFRITNSTYASNRGSVGGVMSTFNSSFSLSNSLFINNCAKVGGVAGTFESSFSVAHSNFIDNSALYDGAVMYTVSTFMNYKITMAESTFRNNTAGNGIMFILGATVDVINGTFHQNIGSFYVFSCTVTFIGITSFENGTEPPSKSSSKVLHREGGAITSYHSNVTFTGTSILLQNQARDGGAIFATDSEIIMWGEVTIANNLAVDGKGGGINLIQCDLIFQRSCNFIQNHALRGGGIHASSSPIVVHQQGVITFTNNSAKNGGGLYLKVNSRLTTISKFPGILSRKGENGIAKFIDNRADNGGAIYVSDNASVACYASLQCYIQSEAVNKLFFSDTTNIMSTVRSILFYGNTAVYHGSNIFGGLFDRCTPSPFAQVYSDNIIPVQYSGIHYLQTISNIRTLDSITSYPVRVCFCNSTDQPDCNYEMPTIKVRKGEAFSLTIVAVDQVNRSVNASIRSILVNDAHGRMGEGQQLQITNEICKELTYNVFSPDGSEIIMLFADGPCMGSVLSRRNVSIQFLDCTCSVGFEPSPSISKCECICDSTLSSYISDCSIATNSVFRVHTNSWITFTNDTDPPGFIIYPVCPLDYCYRPNENVSMNLNLPSGSDAQCAHNRSGILCGACQPTLSLSLGSSCCLSCPNHWPLVFISITLAALIAGILLVTVILILNMTVADGMINAIIFFANVTAPFDRIVHSSTTPSFPAVFVAWLNLDIGFDVCFFEGLDTYSKTWLQLLFPAYIISLVAIVIKFSEYSPKFTRIISSRRRDPVATLATLILLSYAKLLSVTISVLSFATLIYPDGSKSMVWLADGNVQYLRGKHIALAIVIIFIVLIGVPYTFCLFSWQWLIRIPKIKVNRWTKLNSIITAYHAPYNNRHRYWSGLLLVVRIVLYITVAVTVSNNPQIPLLMTVILVGGLLFLKGLVGTRLYIKSSVDTVETIILLNLLLFSAFSLYNFKTDSRKETAITYISTSTVFLLLIGEIVFNISLSIGCKVKKKSLDRDGHTQLLQPLVRSSSLLSEVTHSSIEISIPTPSPNEHGRDDFEGENETSFAK